MPTPEEIKFLSIDQVIVLHDEAIRESGGLAGLQNRDRLEAAVAMPDAGIGDLRFHEDVHEMAAAYLYYISRSHAFADGNKRTATAACLLFLASNGCNINFESRELAEIVLSVVLGTATKHHAAEFLRGKPR